MTLYILEDEINVLNYLKGLLAKIPFVEVLGCSDSVEQAKTEIPVLKPDVLLCDIQLKDSISFRLFETLAYEDYHIIFMTAFSQYAIQALNVGALSYLLKPIDIEELKEALQKALMKKEEYKVKAAQIEVLLGQQRMDARPDKIVLKNQSMMQIVQVDQVLYCEGDKGYTNFYLEDGSKHMTSKILKEYESFLLDRNFIRCHQSYLVNMDYAKIYYMEGYLVLENNTKIPVSESKKSAVLKYLKDI